ncbi:MAG: FMN-dependent NADH-azoreductase [Hasllibacter sp.]
MTVLRIDASARTDGSVTRQLTDRIVDRLGDGDVVTRDLAAAPPVLVTEEMIGAYFTAPDERTDAQRAAIAPSDEVVAELRAADTVVIGMPVYNFGPPAALKAWADLAARVGETFRYEADGPKGLLEGKRAIVAVASGGTRSGSEIDWATPWLRFFLGFLGIEDVTVVTADQLNEDADTKIERAYEDIDALRAAA